MKEDTTPIDPTWIARTGGYARDMTLRDHYAGLAMLGFTVKYGNDGNHKERSSQAYEMADAMLKARETK